MLFLLGPTHSAPSELSDNSSTHGFADFPPSPDSWLGETPHRYWKYIILLK